ncbi:low molecular weight protein-tyrosine-phosphatase [Phaeovulum sp.]|uniref:low molecular weight protein-tyrosine-phosphatase n=1 Tax=Phaeovulum sp. TaxID=2934796 RepID=UPI0039E45298
MIEHVLVVCVGNICRSPLGERLIAAAIPQVTVSSAGLSALVGQPADPVSLATATRHGVDLAHHSARQFTPALGAAQDLILVMEPRHKQEIARQSPQLSGRVMLFDHWTGARGIADPYRRSPQFHEAIFQQISDAADAWAIRLGRGEVRG